MAIGPPRKLTARVRQRIVQSARRRDLFPIATTASTLRPARAHAAPACPPAVKARALQRRGRPGAKLLGSATLRHRRPVLEPQERERADRAPSDRRGVTPQRAPVARSARQLIVARRRRHRLDHVVDAGSRADDLGDRPLPAGSSGWASITAATGPIPPACRDLPRTVAVDTSTSDFAEEGARGRPAAALSRSPASSRGPSGLARGRAVRVVAAWSGCPRRTGGLGHRTRLPIAARER